MLSRIFALSLLLVIATVFAALASFAWWDLWMYSRWPAPPEFLRTWFPDADGEAAYDVVQVEMFVTLALTGIAAIGVFHWRAAPAVPLPGCTSVPPTHGPVAAAQFNR